MARAAFWSGASRRRLRSPSHRVTSPSAWPLGLANGVRLNRDVAEGQPLRLADVAFDATDPAVSVRREMEAAFARPDQRR